MATIVPVSHCQRWRSRSRNQSTDFLELDAPPLAPPFTHDNAMDHPSDDDDDDDQDGREFDDVQIAPWLVIPQGYASAAQLRSIGSPASPATPANAAVTAHSWRKAMEMRRASES